MVRRVFGGMAMTRTWLPEHGLPLPRSATRRSIPAPHHLRRASKDGARSFGIVPACNPGEVEQTILYWRGASTGSGGSYRPRPTGIAQAAVTERWPVADRPRPTHFFGTSGAPHGPLRRGCDFEVYVGPSDRATQLDVPTAGLVEHEPGAPFLAWPVVAAAEVVGRAPRERPRPPVRSDGGDDQRPDAGHAPHDLDLRPLGHWLAAGETPQADPRRCVALDLPVRHQGRRMTTLPEAAACRHGRRGRSRGGTARTDQQQRGSNSDDLPHPVIVHPRTPRCQPLDAWRQHDQGVCAAGQPADTVILAVMPRAEMSRPHSERRA